MSCAQACGIEQFSAADGRTLGKEDIDRDNWAVTEMGRNVSGTGYVAGVEVLNRYTRKVTILWARGFDLLGTLLRLSHGEE